MELMAHCYIGQIKEVKKQVVAELYKAQISLI